MRKQARANAANAAPVDAAGDYTARTYRHTAHANAARANKHVQAQHMQHR